MLQTFFRKEIIGYASLLCIVFIVIYFLYLSQRHNYKNQPNTLAQPVTIFFDSFSSLTSKESLSDKLGQILGLKVQNLSNPYLTTFEALSKVSQLTQYKVKGLPVIISLGLGDLHAKVPLNKTIENLEKIFTLLHQAGYFVVYVEITPRNIGDNWSMVIKQECQKAQVLTLFDTTNGILDNKRLVDSTGLINAQGSILWAQRIAEGLRKVIVN